MTRLGSRISTIATKHDQISEEFKGVKNTSDVARYHTERYNCLENVFIVQLEIVSDAREEQLVEVVSVGFIDESVSVHPDVLVAPQSHHLRCCNISGIIRTLPCFIRSFFCGGGSF